MSVWSLFYTFNTGWVLLVLAWLTGLIVVGTTHCLWSTAYLLHILFLKILMALFAALNWWLLGSTDFHLQSLVLNYDLKVVPPSNWLHWGVVAVLFPLCHCSFFYCLDNKIILQIYNKDCVYLIIVLIICNNIILPSFEGSNCQRLCGISINCPLLCVCQCCKAKYIAC